MKTKNADSFGMFLKHMPRSYDLTLVVLKGHLLVEEEINEILTLKLNEPKALFNARLTFSQRLAVLMALYGSGNNSPFRFGAIEHLNRLRNQLAHNLEPKEIEERVMAFLHQLEEPGFEKEFSKEKLSLRLRRCIALLCGELAGWQRGYKAAKSKVIFQ